MLSTWKWSLATCEHEFNKLTAAGLSAADANAQLIAQQGAPEPHA